MNVVEALLAVIFTCTNGHVCTSEVSIEEGTGVALTSITVCRSLSGDNPKLLRFENNKTNQAIEVAYIKCRK